MCSRRKSKALFHLIILTSTIDKMVKLQLVNYLGFRLNNSITAFKIQKVIIIEEISRSDT
jgi:hypothetical protein